MRRQLHQSVHRAAVGPRKGSDSAVAASSPRPRPGRVEEFGGRESAPRRSATRPRPGRVEQLDQVLGGFPVSTGRSHAPGDRPQVDRSPRGRRCAAPPRGPRHLGQSRGVSSRRRRWPSTDSAHTSLTCGPLAAASARAAPRAPARREVARVGQQLRAVHIGLQGQRGQAPLAGVGGNVGEQAASVCGVVQRPGGVAHGPPQRHGCGGSGSVAAGPLGECRAFAAGSPVRYHGRGGGGDGVGGIRRRRIGPPGQRLLPSRRSRRCDPGGRHPTARAQHQ